jgi:hypothetical protein
VTEGWARHVTVCVFGVDQIMCPLTSDIDSDTRSRRRMRSTERTRSAAHSPNRSPHRLSTKIIIRYAPAIRQILELGHR